jgi:ABC-type Fe3+/spermidine/putrescine transport system ATPase subunit
MVLSDEVAVMHEGHVLQVAAPETVYTRPANRTVAAFVGAPNLLAAKTREVRPGGGASLARVEGEGWEGWCSGPEDLAPGEPVTVIVRPEVIQLGGRAGAGIAWTGRVQQRSSAAPGTCTRARSDPTASAWMPPRTRPWRRAPPSR